MIEIGRKDIFWNYTATFLKIAAAAILLPFILRMMPPQMVGIWSVFMTVNAFGALLDFGFSPSFTRNLTYVFSGVQNLKENGFETVSNEYQTVDFGLLKGVINSMRWIYFRMSILLFLLLITLGTYYIHTLLRNYQGDPKEVYIAWVVLCLVNTYSLYTSYYDSLMQGKGLIKITKQILILGQIVYLATATILIIKGFGLVAIIAAQSLSVILIRWLSYNSFFTKQIKQKLKDSIPRSQKEIMNAIFPNAIKIGLTSVGGFLVQKSAIIIGSLYLKLEEIASYGITIQFIGIIAGFAAVYTVTYQSKIAYLRVLQDSTGIKKLYLKGQITLIFTYILGGIFLLIFGEQALNLIGSKTQIISSVLVAILLIVSLLETNHSIAGMILLSKNEVPFFKASLVSGLAIVFLLLALFQFTSMGLLVIIIAPGLVQAVYQNWKWPSVVFKELNIKPKDMTESIVRFFG